MKLTKLQRECIRQKFGCRCSYCGEPLGEKFHVDHLVPVKRDFEFVRNPLTGNHQARSTGTLGNPEADNYDNLMPACARCNLNKHSMSLDSWRGMIERFLVGLNSHGKYAMYQHAKRFGLVLENGDPKVEFWFEKFLKGETGTPVSTIIQWHKIGDKKPEIKQSILLSPHSRGYKRTFKVIYEPDLFIVDEDMWCAMPTPTGVFSD